MFMLKSTWPRGLEVVLADGKTAFVPAHGAAGPFQDGLLSDNIKGHESAKRLRVQPTDKKVEG